MWTMNLLVQGVPSFRVSMHVASPHLNVPEIVELVSLPHMTCSCLCLAMTLLVIWFG